MEVNRRRDGIAVDGVMRLDQVNGTWVACDWWGGPIGDNIALVQYVEPGTNFPDAMFKLTGASDGIPVHVAPARQKPEAIRRPSIPYERGRGAGRDYLREVRGISQATIVHAEVSGMLRYLDNGILITGRDASRSIRSATVRHITPVKLEDGSLLTKRDLADTDKTYPAILPGSPVRIAVVEGGINALAVRDLALRAGQEPPTVVVTGGVGVRKWVRDNDVLRAMLERADLVEVWAERETTPAKQQETDARRQQLADAIAETRQGEIPATIVPPIGVKDAAEWNAIQQRPTPAQDPDRDSSPGM